MPVEAQVLMQLTKQDVGVIIPTNHLDDLSIRSLNSFIQNIPLSYSIISPKRHSHNSSLGSNTWASHSSS
jgi:hypothetical protein